MPFKKGFLAILALFLLLTFQGCSTGATVTQNSDSSAPTNQNIVQTVKKTVTPFKFSQKLPSEGLMDKVSNFAEQLGKKQSKKGPRFYLTGTVVDKYLTFLWVLQSFYDKRYSDEEIKNAYYSQVKTPIENGSIGININVLWVGGYDDSITNLVFDDNAFEYFFLENEKGEYVKATNLNWGDTFDRKVDYLNQQVSFTIYFPQAEVDKMMQNSKQLFLTFKGLKIVPADNENRVELKYPFSDYYQKDFPELMTMVQEMDSYRQ